jgi:hypothetical protein
VLQISVNRQLKLLEDTEYCCQVCLAPGVQTLRGKWENTKG